MKLCDESMDHSMGLCRGYQTILSRPQFLRFWYKAVLRPIAYYIYGYVCSQVAFQTRMPVLNFT